MRLKTCVLAATIALFGGVSAHGEQSTSGAFNVFIDPVASHPVQGRFLIPVDNWVGMSINAKFAGGWSLDDPAQAGWYARMTIGAGNEGYSVFRIAPGAGGAHTNLFTVNNVGNVGIGANVNNLYAGARLTIHEDRGQLQVKLIDDRPVGTGPGAGIELMGTSGETSPSTVFATVKGVKANLTVGNTQGNLVVTVNDGTTTPREVARFHPGGVTFVGDVEGTNIKAKYQDLAEWVPATSDLAPGTVVVLNPERDNEVMPSARAYDTTVAGVVSERPGLILGEPAESKETIATTGRVRVHVDATSGPIAIGDLLVTSDRPGVAMKSIPMTVNNRPFHQPGTILGKALQPLASGEGEILVLLSLQ